MADAFKEGNLEGKLETATNLKKMGLSINQIKEATGLSDEDLKGLND